MGGSAGETSVRALESLLLSDRRNETFRECPRSHVAAQFTPSVSFIKRMSSARINSEFNIAIMCSRCVRGDLEGACPFRPLGGRTSIDPATNEETIYSYRANTRSS